jgi:uncharacterized membrane protein YedE/YeeE
MQTLIALLAGGIFGIGLVAAEMTNPAKVLAFLDLGGTWDPSLAFVMAGAVLVAAVAFRLAGRRERSLLGAAMQVPAPARIDRRLVLGALAFGAGWGLAGFCPGPAVAALGVSLAAGNVKPLIFAAAMVAGMGIHALLERRRFVVP